MNLSSIIGLLFATALIVAAIVLGPNVETFLNLPSITIVVGLVLAWGLHAFGASALAQAVKTVLRAAFRSDPLVSDESAPEQAAMLREMRSHLYFSGVIGTLIGWIQMAASMDDLSTFGPAWAVSMLTLFYALLMDQCLVKPALHRVQRQVESSKLAES